MALPAITKMQQTAQKMQAAREKQLAASTIATQSGSTSTPTVTTKAPTAGAGSVAAITQPQVNLFNPIKTITPQIPQLTPISLTKEPEKQATMTELFSDKKVDSPSVTSTLAKMYDVLPENAKKPVENAIEDNAKKILYRIGVNKLRSTKAGEAINMFSNKLMIGGAKETIEIGQGYLQKMYNADLLPGKTNMAMNMLMPGYPIYSDYLNKKLENTKIGQQIKETRNSALEAVFDWMEKGEKKLSNLEGYKYATKKQEEWSDKGKGIMDAIDEGRRDIVATNVGETAGQMLPSLIMGFITKNPKIAAGGIFTTVFGSSYKRSLLEINNNPEFDHLTAAQKDNLATAMAVVEAGIETLGDIIELAPFLKGKNLSIGNMLGIKNALLRAVVERQGASVIEGGEEVLTEILQNAFKRAYGGSDRATAQELGHIFSDTYFIMQFLGAVGGVKGGIETHRRNTAEKLLAHEAENFDNFEEFLEDAHRGGVEDDELIADAWATSKGLTNEDRAVIKRDVTDVKKQEDKARTLYEEKQNIETELTQLRLSPTENETQIKNLETRLQEIDNSIQEIDNKIQEYQSVYNQKLPAQPRQFIQREGGENLSQQTMRTVSDVRMTRPANRQEAQDAFRRSVEQVRNNIPYMETEFAKYAYTTSGRQIDATQKRRDKLINKVQTILNRAGITLEINNNLGEGVEGRYYNGTASYSEGTTNMIVYGHEVYHAMMDVVNNGTLSDKKLQQQLKEEMDAIIEMAKKYLYIDDIQYASQESEELANQYAEEWLSNAFGEYLANRELPELGPKSFIERVENFFKRLINAISRVFNSDKRKMENVFRNILEGNIRKPSVFVNTLRGPSYMISPIEFSTDITQDTLKDVEGEAYANIQRENETQKEQQESLASEPKLMEQIGKQAEKDNQTEETAEEAGQDETTKETTTPNTIREAMTGTPDQKKRAFRLMNTEVGQAVKDMFTPAISRLYNISPRIAGRVVTMEAQRDIRIHRYRQQAKPFVEAVSKLSKEDRLKLKKALLDYGALASKQTEETIAQYKEEQTAKLKETFKELGMDESIVNDMFTVLNDLGQRYKDAGLSITLTDMYFPRVVTDYKGLSEFIGSKKELADLRNRIAKIGRNENMTDVEKENAIRRALTEDSKTPGTTSKHGKKRQLGLLSEFGEGIYKYYADPIEALDSYFVNMENAIQRQLFLGGLQEEAGLRGDNVSFSEIVEGLVDKGQISNEDLEEVKKTVLAILNKKPSLKVISGLKNMTYVATLTNFLSAINQLDDLGMTIIKNKSGLKNVVKTIFKRADIKYDELGLDDSYEMFREQGRVTNWLFRKSGFNTFDRLGKESFVNTAWQSLIDQAKGDKSRENLISRLESMYGKDVAERMMKKIDKGDYNTDGQIDIEILTDLLYQLGSTQPIFTSAMPTAYLNHPWVRLCYALSSFTIKRIDWLIQGTKNVNKNHGPVAAGAWLMGVSIFLAMFGVAIGDVGDWIKGDEEETVIRKLINEGIDKALKEMWKEGKESRLKLWNVSSYDKNMYKRQGGWGVFMNKVKPAMIGIGKNFVEAVTEHNKDEMTDLIQYIPIIGKLLYYRFFDEIGKATNATSGKFGKTSVGTSGPVNTSKFGGYSVK